MNKEEIRKKFEENVAYLQRNIPPDDIYLFTEQTFMAALFFLQRWAKVANITEEMLLDPVTDKWVRNILNFHDSKEKNVDVYLDLNLRSLED